jgi:hypothetical protein
LRQCHHFYKTKILRIHKSDHHGQDVGLGWVVRLQVISVVKNECRRKWVLSKTCVIENASHQKRVLTKMSVIKNACHQKCISSKMSPPQKWV